MEVWSLEAGDCPGTNSFGPACLDCAPHGLRAKNLLLGQKKCACLLS